MAFQIAARTPKGKPKSYLDTDTGEIISARQYRNRTEAQSSGFASISAKQKGTRKQVHISPKQGLVQHHYALGLPKNLHIAISTIIRNNYDRKDSMQLVSHWIVEEQGDAPYKTAIGSLLVPALNLYIRSMIDEVKTLAIFYAYTKLLGYTLIIFPEKGAL